MKMSTKLSENTKSNNYRLAPNKMLGLSSHVSNIHIHEQVIVIL